MAVLALGRRTQAKPSELFPAIRAAEARLLREYVEARHLLYVGYFSDWSAVLLIWSSNDTDEVGQFVSRLPTAKTGVFQYSLSQMHGLLELKELLAVDRMSLPVWWPE